MTTPNDKPMQKSVALIRTADAVIIRINLHWLCTFLPHKLWHSWIYEDGEHKKAYHCDRCKRHL